MAATLSQDTKQRGPCVCITLASKSSPALSVNTDTHDVVVGEDTVSNRSRDSFGFFVGLRPALRTIEAGG